MPVTSYRDLLLWRRAMDLAEEVYRLSRSLPRTEQFRLTSQILRSVASVPANIAEGHARAGPREFLRFLSIARGSLAETETFLLLSVRAGLLQAEQTHEALSIADEVSRMMSALKQRLVARVGSQVRA